MLALRHGISTASASDSPFAAIVTVICSTEKSPSCRAFRRFSGSPTVKWRQRQMTGMPGKAGGRQLPVWARFGFMGCRGITPLWSPSVTHRARRS